MAIRTSSPDPIGPAETAPGIDTTAAPGYTADPRTGRLGAFLNQLGAGAALGTDIEKYLETLKSYLPKDGAASACGPVRVQRLSEPNGAHAFIVGEKAMILLFEALLPKDMQNFVPVSGYGAIASQALRRESNINGPLNVILVQPEDYTRAQQMAAHLTVHLAVATNAKFSDETIELLNGIDLVADPNPELFRSYIDQHSPHSVQERGDYGFTILAKFGRRPGFSQVEDLRPIAAVSAYTEILRNGTTSGMYPQVGQAKFVPVVHITNITADLAHPGIIPLCLAQAANLFVDQQRWLQPLMTFQKTKPNLGNLTLDPTTKNTVGFLNSSTELSEWLQNNMMPSAVLAVDVAEGRARIPALAVYGDLREYGNRVFDQITAFFGPTMTLDRNRPAYYSLAQTYLGVYGDPKRGGALLDSRHLDYLDILATSGPNQPASMLMEYPQDPVYRARLISDLTSHTFRSLWWTQLSIMDPGLLSNLARTISSRVRISGPSQQAQMVSTPYLNEVMQGYVRNSFQTTAAPRGGFTGATTHYTV